MPASDLVAEIAVLPEVLSTPEPQIPVLRDWSYRWDESLATWGGRFSHWVDWSDADTTLIASALTPEVDELVDGLIERWAWMWPDVAAQVVPTREPGFIPTLTGLYSRDLRYRRKQDAFARNWLDTALHEGLFEHFRHERRWSAPRAQPCHVCGRIFPPETLSHWMRQYGPPRYCASCCCRARNGSRLHPRAGHFGNGGPERPRTTVTRQGVGCDGLPARSRRCRRNSWDYGPVGPLALDLTGERRRRRCLAALERALVLRRRRSRVP